MSDNNFFQLIAEFQKNIDWINQILKGGEADSVVIDGLLKPSISKDIHDKWFELRSLVQGRLTFKTKAELDAHGHPSNGELAEVWNDSLFDNNGLYGWDGASWLRSPMDTMVLTALTSKIADNRSLKNADALRLSSLAETTEKNLTVYPLVTDLDGRILLGVSEDGQVTGDVKEASRPAAVEELNKFGGANCLDDVNGIIPIFTDSKGTIVLGMEKTTGKLVGDIRRAYHMSISGDYATTTEELDVYPLAVDANGRVLLGINKETGKLVASIDSDNESSYPPKVLEPIPVEHHLPSTDWQHFAFYGQSLSVGIQSKPAITTVAKYDSLTFVGGPKSTMEGSVGYNPGMDGVKLLVEDNLWGDMPNAMNHGETSCSGLSDGVIQLSAQDNGIDWSTDGKQLFVNTAGLGSASIKGLLPGGSSHEGEWWLNMKNSVEQAYAHAQTQGKTYSFHAVGWIQGEGDTIGSTYDRYKTDLGRMHTALQQLSEETTGLTHPVAFFTYQTYGRSGQADNIPQAQLDYCRENEHAYLATPIYHIPMAYDGHLNNVGSYLLGRYFARAYKLVSVDKVKAPWINPISAVLKGNVIIVKYDVPKPPLVLDVVNLARTEDYGFRVIDDDGTIAVNMITVKHGNEVHITLEREVHGSVLLRYAFDYRGDGLINYANSCSGNLRDSETETTTFNGQTYPLFNVAPHHKLSVIKL